MEEGDDVASDRSALDALFDAPGLAPETRLALLERLLGAGADASAADERGLTPLHRAVTYVRAAEARVLLARGASRGACYAGMTPLALALDFQRAAHLESATMSAEDVAHARRYDELVLLLK